MHERLRLYDIFRVVSLQSCQHEYIRVRVRGSIHSVRNIHNGNVGDSDHSIHNGNVGSSYTSNFTAYTFNEDIGMIWNNDYERGCNELNEFCSKLLQRHAITADDNLMKRLCCDHIPIGSIGCLLHCTVASYKEVVTSLVSKFLNQQ
jgi:hypothetical protein